MNNDDKKRLIQRELTALERLGAREELPERLRRIERLAQLYYSVGQYQDAGKKFHDYRILAVSQGELSPSGATAIRLREAWCHYERGDYDAVKRSLDHAAGEIEKLDREDAEPLGAELDILHGYLDIRRGRYDEALQRCDRAFTALQRSDDDAALAKVQILYGHGFFRTGEMTRAREYYEDALASARRADDATCLVQATINLALVCKEQGDSNRALFLLDHANDVLKKSGTYSYRGHVLLNLAVIHSHRGNLQLAEESYRDALRIYLQTGQQQGVVLARIGIARIQVMRGRLEESRSLMESTLATAKESGYLREEVLLRRDLGDVERLSGDNEKALATYEEALEAAASLGPDSEHAVQIGRRIGVMRLRLGNREEGASELRRALLTARKVGEQFEEAVLLCALGGVAGMNRKWEEFDRLFGQGIEMLRRMGERIELGKALVRHARIGMDDTGREVTDLQLELAEGRRIFFEAGVPLWQGKARLEEARLLTQSGDAARGQEAMVEAERVFSELNDPNLLDQIDRLRRTLEDQIVDRSVSGRNDHLAIHDLLPTTTGGLDLASLLDDLVNRTGSDRAVLYVFDADGMASERAVHGIRAQAAREVREVLSRVLDAAYRESRPFLSTAVSSDPRIPGRVLSAGTSVRSLLVVPFQTNADIQGAIYLDREDHRTPFASRELDLVVGLVRSQRFILSLLSTRQKELVEENSRLRQQMTQSGRFDEIVTQSESMYEVLDLVRKVAGTNVTVLIQGETGTGKQLVAKAVHSESPRCEKSFYSVNCATLPEQLLESELFGHAAGSFTGANADKVGLLAEAIGSTVFLDEIDKMNVSVQSKLLHVLEEKRIRPIGSNNYLDVDVRFICASNRDLMKEVKEGRFLEDLYYRLNVIKIDLPPLRKRLEDVLLLSQYFLRVFSAEMGKETTRLDENAAQALLGHAWPGNVRELRSEMRRIVVLNDATTVSADALSAAITGGPGASPKIGHVPGEGTLREQVECYERELLVGYLDRFDGNVTRMSKELGLSRWGLHKKLEKLGLRRS